MKRQIFVIGCAVALALGSVPARAGAQVVCTADASNSPAVPCSPSTATMNITITIGRAIYLALAPANTVLTPPTSADYTTGYAPTTGPTATVYSNTGWSLTIKANTALWSAVATSTEPVRANKPAADLQWALAAGGPFTDMTVAGVSIGTSATKTAGTAIPIFYRTKYAWTLDTPGNYSLAVVFTLTSP